jgi:parallel beta-helix repeat protein
MLLAGAAAHLHAGNRAEIARDTVIATDLIVDSTATCTVRPGVAIRFDGYRRLEVRGLLVAEGTGAQPILLSAVGRPRGARTRPEWQGLLAEGGNAHVRLRHCRIEGAYTNTFWGAHAVLDSCEIVGNYHGIYCTRGAQVHIKGCRVYRNVYGVTANSAAPLLLGNTITDNTVGVYLEQSAGELAGRNLIRLNDTDVKTDETLQHGTGAPSIRQLWDAVRQLY